MKGLWFINDRILKVIFKVCKPCGRSFDAVSILMSNGESRGPYRTSVTVMYSRDRSLLVSRARVFVLALGVLGKLITI